LDSTSRSVVSSLHLKRNATLRLEGIAGISATDVWAVGFAKENWDGTSCGIVTSPAVGQLKGMATLGNGTVVIVSSGVTILEK
jgi:hypothetical protein